MADGQQGSLASPRIVSSRLASSGVLYCRVLVLVCIVVCVFVFVFVLVLVLVACLLAWLGWAWLGRAGLGWLVWLAGWACLLAGLAGWPLLASLL